MADQLTTTKEFQIELGYGGSGEENVRKIKLPISGNTDSQVAEFWKDALYSALQLVCFTAITMTLSSSVRLSFAQG